MQIYRFWTRGRGRASGLRGNVEAECLGYSNSSLEDALRVAERRAGDVAQRIASGEMKSDKYYADSPIREEIVEEFSDEGSDGNTLGRSRTVRQHIGQDCKARSFERIRRVRHRYP